MVTLLPGDRQRIAQAVAQAETKTSGEVCCVLSEEASEYREVPLAWASLAALVLPPAALAFGFRPLALSEMVSGWAAAQSTHAAREIFLALGSYAIAQAILFAAVALVVSIPAVRRLVTPSFVKRHRVRRMARHHFATLVARLAEGAYAMIYVSRFDRMVEIVVSETAGKACDSAAWHKAAAALSNGLGRDQAGEGFVAAIGICGGELAKHFPPGAAHENRLPDTLIEE
ncbi:MAG: TPM domain-containing protein [Proteobacteria bacterium]|nr:TPM domain-containing protein [Pseudomonadota bacterium]